VTGRLRDFVARVESALDAGASEAVTVAAARHAMRELIAADDWLPEPMTRPHPAYYQQYLLHRDPAGRFSVVSFVWGPGQKAPIHDHTVWGVIGMLRGSELSQGFAPVEGGMRPVGAVERLVPGDVAVVSPTVGDIHQVSNAFDDRVSISIHAYGADIGQVRRHVFDPGTGAAKEFVSGYSGA
jgi:predicted metal-dependent enzyme (double-stranded beta helix superfamily)